MNTGSSHTPRSYYQTRIFAVTLAVASLATPAAAQDRARGSSGSVTRTDHSSGPTVVDVDRNDRSGGRDRDQGSSDRGRADQNARDRAEKERAEKAARERAEKERAEKERAEQAARERAERERAEKAAGERAEKERAEKAARERAEKERAEKAARERAEKERAEKAARERAEKERAEKAARERAEKERAEKAARERAEKEREERERAEREKERERERDEAEDPRDSDEGEWADLTIGRVSASGPGCPSGTWKAQIDASGRGFDVQFTDLEAAITPNQTETSVRCRLTVVVPAKDGRTSYRVGQFAYSGYTYLENGVLAEFVTDYAFAGDPSSAFKVRTELAGPIDKEYTVTDDIGSDALWSPCSTSNTFNVDLTIKLINGQARADGLIEVADASGLSFDLRACD